MSGEATDQGGGESQPVGAQATTNAQYIHDLKARHRAEIIADDSIEVDTPDDGADAEDGAGPQEPASASRKPASGENTNDSSDNEAPASKPAEAPQTRKSLTDLEKLAAEKRRERQEREARTAAEKRARDLDREREELERERRETHALRDRLKKDPLGYLEGDLGLDSTEAAERLVARQLRPKEAKLAEENARLQARLDALEKRYEDDTRTQQERAEQQRLQEHQRAVYSAWDSLSGDDEKYPRLSRLPAPLRRQYADHVANLLSDAGEPWTQEVVAAQIEHDLVERFGDSAEANGRSAGEQKKDGSPRGGEKAPPKTLTNDLASESAGSARIPPGSAGAEARRQQALREAAKLGLK